MYYSNTFDSQITSWTGTNASVALATSEFRTGSGSLKITMSGTATGKGTYTTYSMGSGTQLIMKLFVKGDSTSSGKFVKAFIQCDGNASVRNSVPVKLSSSSWSEIWVTSCLPSTGTVTIGVQGVNLGTTDNVYVDDLTLDSYFTPVMTVKGRSIFKNGVKKYFRGMGY